ncbi:hypothetical protein PS645_05352 [Pseudomonas fluorescens]|uniref:Uncharacterized protein n=1 Tax=Pseudomonas fluorescens TaxID=294 RepID=A0A5E6XFJ6_PSEFL|nr:hypothetical protein PS645_05352 [Pseudomonas fluorescens]
MVRPLRLRLDDFAAVVGNHRVPGLPIVLLLIEPAMHHAIHRCLALKFFRQWLIAEHNAAAGVYAKQVRRSRRCGIQTDHALALFAMLARDKRGQRTNARMGQQFLQTQFDIQPGLEGGNELDGQNRVPAQFEEIIANAHPLDPQRLLPEFGQRLLQRSGRRHIRLPPQARVRRRQLLAVEFAVGIERKVLEEQQMGRHHVVRQP